MYLTSIVGPDHVILNGVIMGSQNFELQIID